MGMINPVSVSICHVMRWSRRGCFWVSPLLFDAVDVEDMILRDLSLNQNIRICFVRESLALAKKSQRSVLSRLGTSVERAAACEIQVRRTQLSIDPSVSFVSSVRPVSRAARYDVVYATFDHPLDGLRSVEERLRLFRSEILGRLCTNGLAYIFVSPGSSAEVGYRLMSELGWPVRVMPLAGRETGESVWPEKYPNTELTRLRLSLGEAEAARQMDCRIIGHDTSALGVTSFW